MEKPWTTSTNSPAKVENASVHRDPLSLLELNQFPKPTVRQYEEPVPNDAESAAQTVKTNTAQGIGANASIVTRRDTIQNTNGCRRHVIVWG